MRRDPNYATGSVEPDRSQVGVYFAKEPVRRRLLSNDVRADAPFTIPAGAVSHTLRGRLGPLASRYVKVDDLPWKPTPCAGIDMKILLEDKETGLLTALFRWQPGAELTLHEHVEVEQTFVIEGSLVDDEGEVTAGNYVWRPKGNRHIAKSPGGALVLSVFLKPNIFLGGAAEGQPLR